jgi:hypothetical protein
MHELPSQLRLLRDFYYTTALTLPAETCMAHAHRLMDTPAFFTMEHLQRHLNNPLLMPGWFSLFWKGKAVDCMPAVGNKVVQNATLSILNKGIIQEYLSHGAALLLEGVECLEPDVNAMCAAIDAPHQHVMSNAVVFFSQRGSEAYRGHFDTDDALIIHLAGQKKWRIYERVPPRLVEQGDLTVEQLGKVQAEIVMNPGDALFLRSCTPHLVETTAPYSLHMTFDICDHNVNAETALSLLTQQFAREATRSYTPTEGVVDKLMQHARSPAYWKHVQELQSVRAENCRRTRAMLSGNCVTHFTALMAAERQPAQSGRQATREREQKQA